MSKSEFKINLKMSREAPSEKKRSGLKPSRNSKQAKQNASRRFTKQKFGNKGSKKEQQEKDEDRSKQQKVSKNWSLVWTRVPSFLEGSEDIWIRRWVKVIEGEEKVEKPPTKKEPGQRIYKCKVPDCQKVFYDQGTLKKHLATHGERQFICEIATCGKKFLDKSKLKRHQLVHSGEKAYECEICFKKFSLDFNLRTHIRIHTGQKPYLCSFNNCGKCYSQSSNLVAHEKSHAKNDLPSNPLPPGEQEYPLAPPGPGEPAFPQRELDLGAQRLDDPDAIEIREKIKKELHDIDHDVLNRYFA